MPQFQYTAMLPAGQQASGVIDAADLHAAQQSLAATGLTQIQLGIVASANQPPLPSATAQVQSADDAQQFTEHLAILMQSGLPLAPGLRATAKELANRRLADAFNRLADQMDAGRSLDEALAKNSDMLPAHVRQLIIAGAKSGRLADILVRYVDIQRSWLDVGRSIRLALAYPIVLFAVLGAVTFFAALFVSPTVKRTWSLFGEFKVSHSLPERWLMWCAQYGLFVVCGSLALLLIVGIISFLLPRALRQRFVPFVPVIGSMVRCRALSFWTRLLNLLLLEKTPVPDALRLAGDASEDFGLTAASSRLAKFVSDGSTLADAMSWSPQMPRTLIPIVHWGEEAGALPEAFLTASDMFESRAQAQAALLHVALPPIAFVMIGFGAVCLFNALMAPFFALMRLVTSLGW
jgi:type II secretory pathway component PulF